MLCFERAPTVHALPSAHALHVRTRILSAPKDSTRSRAMYGVPQPVRTRAHSRLRPQLFRLAPGTLPWIATSDCQPPRRWAIVRKITAVK
jgi:hypothetical protein